METERKAERPRGGDGRSSQTRPRNDERAHPLLDGALSQLRQLALGHPYLTLTASFGAGLILGGGLPLRAVIALLAVGARSAAASALEGALRQGFAASRPNRTQEDRSWFAR